MKVKIVTEEIKSYKETGVGTIGYIRNARRDQNNGRLVLRAYGVVVCLTDPKLTWPDDHWTFDIEPISSGTAVVLTQE